MAAIIDIVLPVFVLVALGYLAARTAYLSAAAGDGLAAYVFNVGIPVLLGRAVATMSFGDADPWAFWGAYFGGFALCWLGALALMVIVFRRDMRTATVGGLSAGFSNLVLFGVPLIEQAYGAAGLQVLFVLLALHLPILLTLSTFAMEFAVRRDGADTSELRPLAITIRLTKQLGRNPIIIGILAGVVWRLVDPVPPDMVADLGVRVMDLLAQTTGPLALFALGMGAAKFGLRGDVVPAIALAALALVGLPAAIWVLGTYAFTLPPLWLKVAVTAASCPTGVNAYLFASHFKVAERLATSTIILALAGSVVTVPLWLAFVA